MNLVRAKIAVVAAAVGLGGVLSLTATAPAQLGISSEITYKLATGKAPVGPSEARSGPTTFVASTSAKEGSIQLLRLAGGADPQVAAKALRAVRSADQFERITSLTAIGGVDLRKRTAGRFIVTLVPGTYLVADLSDDKITPSTVLTVTAEPNGAQRPSALATVRLLDYKLTLNRRLPEFGTVRFVNRSKRNHFVVAFKAADRASARKLSAALLDNDEKRAGRFIRGTGTGVGIVGPGQSVIVSSTYSRGYYALVCFWKSKTSKGKPHNVLGMTKVIRAKALVPR